MQIFLGMKYTCTSTLRTVQLRGKVTLASESHACARAYTRECSSCHSRARECFTPRLTATRECSIARCTRHSRAAALPTPTTPCMRVLYAPWTPCALQALRASAPLSSPRPPSLRALSEPLPDLWAKPSRSLLAFRRYSLRDHWAPTPPPPWERTHVY